MWCNHLTQTQPWRNITICEHRSYSSSAYCRVYENVTATGGDGDSDAFCLTYRKSFRIYLNVYLIWIFLSDTIIYWHLFNFIEDEWTVSEWENNGTCSAADSGLSCGVGLQNQSRTCTSAAPETPCLPGYGVTERTVSCNEAGTLPLCSGLVAVFWIVYIPDNMFVCFFRCAKVCTFEKQ